MLGFPTIDPDMKTSLIKLISVCKQQVNFSLLKKNHTVFSDASAQAEMIN